MNLLLSSAHLVRFAPLLLSGLLTMQQATAALWTDEQGNYTPLATEAVKRLANAGSDGLNPAAYGVEQWQQTVRAGQPAAEQGDAQLTASVEKYLNDLHQGRIDPRQIGENYDGPNAAAAFNAGEVLRSAVSEGRLDSAWHAATPRAPVYAELREQLARHQALSAAPAWAEPLPALPRGGQIRTGQRWAGAYQLAQRLADLGDLPPEAADDANVSVLTPAISSGLKAYQERHALPANGVLNKATLDQLNVAPARRADQIAQAMERVRWTPLLQGPRMIVVNVPEFMLRGYDITDGKPEVKVAMKVVVGKAQDTRTPLFDEDMRFIEFSPYWNVPPSIARKELAPKIERDPGYLARNGYEIVGTGGLQGVLSGSARIRQKPGPRNALGDIKFVFPNNENIYLHHTQSTGLFNRGKRDFSHGCVRVEEPLQLAKFVLQNDPAWTEARIRKAMDSGKSQTLKLKEPIPVLITYSTTVLRDGKLYFLPDLYQQDAKLAQALQRKKN